MNNQQHETDPNVLSLIPHRPPMLLVDELVSVFPDASESKITITPRSTFYLKGKGVPAWIGIEYMGQTAALIAGHQQQTGALEPHLGFLIGIRQYKSVVPAFTLNSTLTVRCRQVAVLGETLANFQCDIIDAAEGTTLAEGLLSVFRKKIEPDSQNSSSNGTETVSI